MSTADPTGEGGEGGGGGGGGESAATTNVEQNASPSTPITDATMPVQQAAVQQQQQQHPPPSPLSGCYLLVVLPEPHTAQHKDLILNRLAKGFLSWDKDSCHVDLEKELLALVAQAPEGEEARNGERLIQYATENLVTEVLIHPQTNTLLQCIRNLLASFTKHRHIIHAGYTFGGNGSWILQDGTFSLADFLDAFSEHEVQRVLRAYENSVTVDIHCAGVGDWTTSRLSKEACCRSCRVRVNPDDVLTAGVPAITSFTNYIGQYLVSQTLDQLMEPSDVVGNIRFSHPTLYVFPGGQGDAALFGINGFNMLVDGGFARKACFWDFTRHLDRLDAVLVTRINNSNIGGMFSVLRKKKEMHVYPQIGHFFCNLVERRQSNSPDGDKDIDPLILNLTDIGQEMVLNLRHINLRAHPCYRDPDPINLYHKVGHGTLDMYVLSPSRDSREVREFLAKWHASDSKLFAGSHRKDTNNLSFPIQNLVSICALLVWMPANPEDNITRILFPGSTPQHKIFEGFERLKHLDFLKHSMCSAKTLSPSTSLATLRDKPAKQKFSLIEKETKKISELKREKREPSEPKTVKATDETVPKTPIISASKPKGEIKTKKVAENKKIETDAKESKKIEPEMKESKKIEKELKEVKKEARKEPAKAEKDDIKKTDLIKPESEKTVLKEPKESKEPKAKPEPKKKEAKESKTTVKPEVKRSETVANRVKRVKPPGTEKKDSVKSSPTTPKKTALNGTATKTEISKGAPKAKSAAKAAPSLPAKSAKEANNRKVVEQKKSEVEKSAVKDTAAPVVKVSAKPKPMDRKPISRRATKPISPSKARLPGSPAKSTRSTPTTSVKSDKDGVIRKAKGDKGTTDSSTVSTPSGIEPEVVKPIDKSLIEQSEDISLDSIESKVLADLKEEREVVEEIEAVLQKAERIEEIRKDDRFEGDDEITAEATDKKEEDGVTEEDVTAEIEDVPKKEGSRKGSQELTEEDEYLIVEKEELYTEDSAQSGDGEQKHVLDEAESEKAKTLKDAAEVMKEKGEKEEPEEKGKDETPEKKVEKAADKDEKQVAKISPEHKEQLQEEVKEIIASAAEIVQKVEEKDDSGKKDSEDITKEPSSLSPDKLDSSEKKTTDTDMKPDVDQKEPVLEKMEESQERISTVESGATTTAPTLPEDERIPLDEIKEDIDEKHVIEEVKEKDAPAKPAEEEIPETVPAPKPEVKVFDVRQPMQSLQRDIVKTPDEVADLPVHEEVDPKLYRMEDFEKGKEEKPTAQDVKEPPTPPVKEQKGVFSFFGKVADKFEKGIDKLTKKSKKDGEKDSDDKSSKSSSPKEAKLLEKTVLEEVDMEKMFPKVGKTDKPDAFEEAKPLTIADVKVAAIKETMAFIQGEILDAQGKSMLDIEEKLSPAKLEKIQQAEDEIKEATDVSPTKPIEDKKIEKEIELLKEEDIGEEAEEVKALLEEASKKFKTVKDSLRDSLESLEEKIKEEEIVQIHKAPSSAKDAVKDTLEGVAEKLEEIKPHLSPDIAKEPEKVKFDIPKDEEFEEEYEEELEGPYRDMKEGIRDVGEVLAGTAGIILDDKPKDVIEIVKKVAEVLKEDDFLSEKTLLGQEGDISPAASEGKPSIPSEEVLPEKAAALEAIKESKLSREDVMIPTKVGITTEELPVHEEVEDLVEQVDKPSALHRAPGGDEVREEPCIKVVKDKADTVTSPQKDVAKDKMDARKICEEMLKKDQHVCDQYEKPADIDMSQMDVMQAGTESVCVKEVAKRPSFEEIEQPVIGFEQKVSPAKAEIVVVTPGSTPTSPKFTTDRELEMSLREAPKLPEDVKQVLNKEAPVDEIIEELIITKKKKITIEIIEYITVVKRIPRERVIYIIEEIIVKRNLSRENVVDVDPEILKVKGPITPEKRMEVEEYIVNEYIVKGKRITIEVVEEISIKKVVPKKIVVEIIEEIIVKRKIARHMVLDVAENALSEIMKEESSEESPEESLEEQITPRLDITTKRESTTEIPSAPLEESIAPQKRTEIENFVVNEYIIKGRKITASVIDEISTTKTVPKQTLIEMIEEIIIRKKIPRNAVLDITEDESSMTPEKPAVDEERKEAQEDEKRKSVTEVPSAEIPKAEEPITPQKRAEVEEHIVNEYITKGDSINIQKLEEICSKKKVPKRIIIEIIEEIIIKRKMPRSTVLSVSEAELSRLVGKEETHESEVSAEGRKSVAEISSPGKEKDEEAVDEEFPAAAEEEDVEEEVDGFISIPRGISDKTADAQLKAISPTAAKEHEKDAIDDFEAVEQEYKVRGIPVTSPEKAHEMREKEEAEDAAEDTTSEVIEADEKFVQETKGKVGKEEPPVAKDITTADEKREPEEPETSELSEIVDATEKYLDEAKEKTDDTLPKGSIAKTASPDEMKKLEPAIKEVDEKSEEPRLVKDDKSKPTIPIKDETSRDTVISTREEVPEKVAEAKPETKLADATGFAGETKADSLEGKKLEALQTAEVETSPLIADEKSPQEIADGALRKKRSISKGPEDEGLVAEPSEKIADEKLAADKPVKIDDAGTVRRMLVTASSEDGREETEICPTGSITFTKSVTPDDSLKDASVKSTPDKDSLLDKESLRSGASTPEKDSISEKSAPEGRDKITPEDSLEKSPVAARDAQDLEDSLEKSESRKAPRVPAVISDKIATKADESKPPEKQEEPISAEQLKSNEKESVEKPKLPIEKTLPESEHEKTAAVPKTPESLRSEDVSPAETIFSKSPTDKLDMYFAKIPIGEEDVEVASKKLPASTEKSRSPSVSGEKPEEKDDASGTPSEKSEEKEPSVRSKSPSIAGDLPEDKLRSPSIASVKSEELKLAELEDKIAEKSRSPSVTAEKLPEGVSDKRSSSSIEREIIEILDKSRSSSIVSGKGEKEEKSRSPSMISELIDKVISERRKSSVAVIDEIEGGRAVVEKSRSPSIADKISDDKLKLGDEAAAGDTGESADKSKSPSIASEQDIQFLDKSSVLSDKAESGEADKPESPILESERDGEKGPIDEARSPSAVSDKSDGRKEADRSKSPSIAADKPDLQDVTECYLEKRKSPIFDRPESPKAIDKTEEPQDKDRSPSIASDKSDSKKVSDHSRSPSISIEKVDSKAVDVSIERSQSLGVKVDGSKSPQPDEETDLKDAAQPPSDIPDKSKSPSPVEQKLDIGGKAKSRSPSIVEDPSIEKARLPSVASVKDDQQKLDIGEKEPIEKSRSPSIAGEPHMSEDMKKSPSPVGEKPDSLTQVSPIDKSRSSSITSVTDIQKDRSKSPSIVDEKPDVTEASVEKSRSSSVASTERKESADRSKPPSIVGERPDIKDVLEPPADKSRSSSVASAAEERKELSDRSKSPSIAGEKVDLKEVSERADEKSRSPSVTSATDLKELGGDRLKSASIAGDQEKLTDEQKTAGGDTKRESIGGSKSPSVASEKSDGKKSTGDSRSSSVAGDKADLADVAEQLADKSKSSTVPDKKEELDRSKSPSATSDKSSEEVRSAISSKPSSVAGDTADLKDVLEPPSDKSRSPSVISATEQRESVEKATSPTISRERSKSPSVASEKSDDKKSVDGSRATSVTEEKPDLKDVELPADKSTSSSVASLSTEKAEPFGKSISPTASDKLEPPVEQSKQSSIAPDKLELVKADDVISDDRSRSPSIVLDKPVDGDDKQPTEKMDIDELKTSSELGLFDKTRSLSIISDKTEPKSPSDASKSPSSVDDPKSRSSSVVSEKLDVVDTKIPEAGSPEDKLPKDGSRSQSTSFDAGEQAAAGTASLFEEKLTKKADEREDLPKKTSPTTSPPEAIRKELQKIREKRFADFEEPDAAKPSKLEKSDDDDEEAGIVKVTAEKRAGIEKYILEEYIARKRKISLVVIEKLVMTYSVPQFTVMEIIEDIISRQNVPRNTVLDFLDDDFTEDAREADIVETKDKPVVPTSVALGGLTREHLHEDREKPSGATRDEDPDGKISPVGGDRCDKDALSASPSLSPEPIPSDKSTQDSPARSEPRIDEEISLSEEKRAEIEKLLMEEYIKKGRRITEVILEEIVIRTSLPRYIILEIVEEIILKRKIPRESVIDVEIYQENEPEEDYEKAVDRYDGAADELPGRDGRPVLEYGIEYSQSGERQGDRSDYPTGYESQFHKAFVGGMTEMRTTHITTLSGKSTPEFTSPESGVELTDRAADKPSECSLTTTMPVTDDSKTRVQPVQTVTILRESKIGEPYLPDKDGIVEEEESEKVTKVVEDDVPKSSDATGRVIKREIIEPQEQPEATAEEVKRSSVQQDEPEAITKIIKREIVEHDEPEVVTKVVKREIIEQDEPEIITKVIRREIVVPDEEVDDSNEEAGEYVRTITTKTTRTIVTEELPDTELSQTDPSKIYTDPTSGATYRVVSEDVASDATTSADVKRIVTTVTTITGPDGKVTTKKDVTESTNTVDSEELLEKLIDSGKIATESTKSAEKIIKETLTTTVRSSGASSPDVRAFHDSGGGSTPDLKHEEKLEPAGKERPGADKPEHSVSPLVRDLISDDKSYSGKSSPDISLPKDIVFSGSTGRSTPEVPVSPLIRDGAAIQHHHLSGRSTPDRRSDGGHSSTGTPEGFRSGEVMRTIITTTKTISDEGDMVTTTREVTETTNERGETVVLTEKTDVKVDERSQSGKTSAERQRSSSAGSDDEPLSSPLSSASQVEYEKEEAAQKQVEFSTAAMSGSFYGELPAVPPQITAMKTFHGETGMQKSSDPIPIHSRFMVEKEFAAGEKPDAKKYVDEADLDFDKALMEHKEMKETSGAFSGGVTPRFTNGSLQHETAATQDHPASSFRDDTKDDSKGDSKKDPLERWGSPLGLPSPKPPRKFNLRNSAQPSCSSETTSDTSNFDVAKDWGEPLGLPSPAPVTNEVSNKGAPSTPRKERKQAKKIQSENIKNKKRSESPGKNDKKTKDSKNKVQPVYMDLAYVPHHGNSYYTSLEFFKRVRARYYVFSGTEPSREVYDALLEAKKTWEDKELEVTMIPTYDTDTLGYWVADNEEALAANRIDLSPSASRCTINLQDHETSCSAYRLEF